MDFGVYDGGAEMKRDCVEYSVKVYYGENHKEFNLLNMVGLLSRQWTADNKEPPRIVVKRIPKGQTQKKGGKNAKSTMD